MKKVVIFAFLIVTFLIVATPIFAQGADVSKVETFITSVIKALVFLAGALASAFFVWGGIRYIISSGNPQALESAKRTILYSAIGLIICLAAFVITSIVTQLAKGAFG